MCECGNKGTIIVYERELKYVRQISGRGMGTFYDLSPDSHGNLYVTDYDNSVIRMFSVDGDDLLRSFGCDENGVKKLSRPQYVYMTDESLHNVSKFITEGEYVTSFGHSGSQKGCFRYPCGLCVDRDGFVHVADYNICRVEVFLYANYFSILLSFILSKVQFRTLTLSFHSTNIS